MADVKEREADAFLVDDDEEGSQASKYLLFNIEDEVYGINIAHVVEIIEKAYRSAREGRTLEMTTGL